MACPRDTLKEAAKTDPGNCHTHHRTGRLVRRRSNILTYSHTLLWFPLYCSCCFPVPYVVGRSRIHILINVLWSPLVCPFPYSLSLSLSLVHRLSCIVHPSSSSLCVPVSSRLTLHYPRSPARPPALRRAGAARPHPHVTCPSLAAPGCPSPTLSRPGRTIATYPLPPPLPLSLTHVSLPHTLRPLPPPHHICVALDTLAPYSMCIIPVCFLCILFLPTTLHTMRRAASGHGPFKSILLRTPTLHSILHR